MMLSRAKGSRKACSCHVEEETLDAPKLAAALNRGVFVRKGAGDTSTHDRMGFGTEAVLQLERIANFCAASGLD